MYEVNICIFKNIIKIYKSFASIVPKKIFKDINKKPLNLFQF